MACFLRGAAVRACNDNAAQHCRSCDPHYRRIDLDRADHHGNENHSAASHGDLGGQDKFAAALDSNGKLVDLRLESHDLVAIIAVVHGCTQADLRCCGLSLHCGEPLYIEIVADLN